MPVETCPACAERGEPVPGQTVKSLLAVSLRQLREAVYRFCSTRTCAVVYYADDGQHFKQAMLRERVFQKDPDNPDTPICYCFAYAVGDVTATGEHDRIVCDIRSGIQAGQCACDLRNPQGTCCLGNVLLLGRKAQPAQTRHDE